MGRGQRCALAVPRATRARLRAIDPPIAAIIESLFAHHLVA